MSGPDFRELVGDEGSPEELAVLRRAHDLLVAAGPPPELSSRLAEAPSTGSRVMRTPWFRQHRRGGAFALAAAVAGAAFGVGFLVGDQGSGKFPSSRPPIAMHSVSSGGLAKASIVIGERDEIGNWPLLVRVSGLPELPKGMWYELYLTRNGKPAAYCGSFGVNPSGRAKVVLSVPYKLKQFDGWIVTPNKPKKARQVLLTT